MHEEQQAEPDVRTRARRLRTGCCVILSCGGVRTMRTYQGGAARLPPEALTAADLGGARWLFLSAYCFYGRGFVQRAAALAREVRRSSQRALVHWCTAHSSLAALARLRAL
jgi:hypothetical protein